jgi:hypothetical protein
LSLLVAAVSVRSPHCSPAIRQSSRNAEVAAPRPATRWQTRYPTAAVPFNEVVQIEVPSASISSSPRRRPSSRARTGGLGAEIADGRPRAEVREDRGQADPVVGVGGQERDLGLTDARAEVDQLRDLPADADVPRARCVEHVPQLSGVC